MSMKCWRWDYRYPPISSVIACYRNKNFMTVAWAPCTWFAATLHALNKKFSVIYWVTPSTLVVSHKELSLPKLSTGHATVLPDPSVGICYWQQYGLWNKWNSIKNDQYGSCNFLYKILKMPLAWNEMELWDECCQDTACRWNSIHCKSSLWSIRDNFYIG
jgi:hypothetical protein